VCSPDTPTPVFSCPSRSMSKAGSTRHAVWNGRRDTVWSVAGQLAGHRAFKHVGICTAVGSTLHISEGLPHDPHIHIPTQACQPPTARGTPGAVRAPGLAAEPGGGEVSGRLQDGRKTASYYDLSKWLTTLRGGEDERTRRLQ